MTKEIYEQYVSVLRRWAKAYYCNDDPIATDDEYDRLYHKVMKYELNNDIINKKSPTQFVGWRN